MSGGHCCKPVASNSKGDLNRAQSFSSNRRPDRLVRRGFHIVQWLVPAAILSLIPKCPMCLAAYVAIMTGMGISISTAAWLRVLLVTLCLGSLAYLAARRLHRILSNRGAAGRP
jgi:hypothetical protein